MLGDGKPIAFIDLETTGLIPEIDRITEVAVIIFRFDEKFHKGYSTLVNPGVSLTPEIIRLTGISDEMLANARPASKVLPELFEFIGDLDIWAFNAKFDMSFLQRESKRIGIKCPDQEKFFCLMETVKNMYPGLPSYRLQSLLEVFKVEREIPGAHRAGPDVSSLACLFGALLAGKKPYGAQNIKVVVENGLIDPDTGLRPSDPIFILGATHPEILSNWPTYKTTKKPKSGELWTLEHLDFINLYAPSAFGGAGLVAKLMKVDNKYFTETPYRIYVTCRYNGRNDEYVLKFSHDEP